MCWSLEVSVCMLTMGIITACFSPPGWIRGEVLFVSLMELLQLIGILVADDCGNPVNLAVTYLSYVHITLQPWFYNEWQWALAARRGIQFASEHKRLVRGLAGAWAVAALFRLAPCISEPCYYCAEREHFCAPDGSSACTYMGSLHIYWKLPLLPVNYLCAGLWGHFSLCFLPSMINGGTYERLQMVLLFLTGAAAAFVVAFWADKKTAFHEGPSLWCIVAIPQHLVTFVAVATSNPLKVKSQ